MGSCPFNKRLIDTRESNETDKTRYKRHTNGAEPAERKHILSRFLSFFERRRRRWRWRRSGSVSTSFETIINSPEREFNVCRVFRLSYRNFHRENVRAPPLSNVYPPPAKRFSSPLFFFFYIYRKR